MCSCVDAEHTAKNIIRVLVCRTIFFENYGYTKQDQILSYIMKRGLRN